MPASPTPSAVVAASPSAIGASSRRRTGNPIEAAMRNASAAPARSSRISAGGSTKHTSVIGEDVIDGANAGKAAIQNQFGTLLDVLRIVASSAAGVDHRKRQRRLSHVVDGEAEIRSHARRGLAAL